jgi:hypothetical protein
VNSARVPQRDAQNLIGRKPGDAQVADHLRPPPGPRQATDRHFVDTTKLRVTPPTIPGCYVNFSQGDPGASRRRSQPSTPNTRPAAVTRKTPCHMASMM